MTIRTLDTTKILKKPRGKIVENDKELLLQNVRFVRNTDNTVCADL